MAELLANDVQTTLAADITSGAASFAISSAAGYPSTGDFRLRVANADGTNAELMLCTARSGTTLTVTRGIEGTAAVAHTAAASVVNIVQTAASIQALLDAAVAVETGRSEAAEALLSGNTVNVLDYGADPTGVADSTTAFQAAATAAGATGTVYAPGAPAGAQYKILGMVTMGLRANLRGDGPDSTIINTSTGASNAFLWQGSGAPETNWPRFLRVADLRIVHTGSAAPMRFQECIHGLLEHVYVQGVSTGAASGNGLELSDCYEFTLINCRAYSFGSSGFQVFSSGATQPGQFLWINCDSGFHTFYGWDYNSSAGVIDGCVHMACIALGSGVMTRGWSLQGSGGLREFSWIDCHVQDSVTASTLTGIYQAGADAVNLKVDGMLVNKVAKPFDFTGTVHGLEVGRVNLIGGASTQSAAAVNTTSSVDGFVLGYFRNASGSPWTTIFDGNATRLPPSSGSPGANNASRYMGATTSGAPTTGTFEDGDYVVDRTGAIWVCTVAGSPGTWANAGSSGNLVTSVAGRTGTIVIAESDVTNLVSDLAAKAPTASPTFTGTVTLPSGIVLPAGVTAPTQAALDNSTKVATTAYADAAVAVEASRAAGAEAALIAKSLITAKGDVIAASGASTPARLGVGSDGQVLTADSTQATGVKWAAGGGASAIPLSIWNCLNQIEASQSAQNVGAAVNAALVPVFYPIPPPSTSYVVSRLGMRVNTGAAGSTAGVAIYRIVYSGPGTYTATLVCQLNAAVSTATSALPVFGDATGGAAGSGPATVTLDFTSNIYVIGVMASTTTTLKIWSTTSQPGLGALAWSAAARASTTDWPSSFTQTSAGAVIASTVIPFSYLMNTDGENWL